MVALQTVRSVPHGTDITRRALRSEWHAVALHLQMLALRRSRRMGIEVAGGNVDL